MENKSKKKLKVFHGFVNYGTQAGLFAQGLRAEGIDALSVSYPDPFKRQIDIELLSGGNLIQKIFQHSRNILKRIYWFFKYNTFHFYYGSTLFPKQRDLPFYKFLGKKVVMEYLGYDIQKYQYSLNKYKTTNVKFYKSKEKSIVLDKEKEIRYKSEIKYINKQLVCAPYLSEFAPDSTVLPLAIDISKYSFSPKLTPKNEIIIMHAPTSRGNKGTFFIEEAIDQLVREGYLIRKLFVENVTHAELKQRYLECDIFIDQILAGWYGTASIEAMALGRPTICFIRESYFKHIDYGERIPIINAEPSTIYDVLKKIIQDKHLLPDIGKKSRAFVEDIHDLKKLTKTLIDIYNNL
jgi:glycosyltransferase involved in cell wall biosynthesis